MTSLRIHVPLTAPGLGFVRILQAVLAIVCVSLWLFVPWIWMTAQKVKNNITNLEESLLQTRQLHTQFIKQTETSGYSLSPARLRTLPQEVQFAKQLSSQHHFSWTQFLNDLEAAVPKNISMESVTLNFKNSSIALSGTAGSLKNLAALVKGLEDHAAFQDVMVSGHKSLEQKKQKRVAFPNAVDFSLEVTYERTTVHKP